MRKISKIIQRKFSSTKFKIKEEDFFAYSENSSKSNKKLPKFLKDFDFMFEQKIKDESNLSPLEMTELLNEGVIGQLKAKKVKLKLKLMKKAMSIAYRNRSRRKESPVHLQKYLTPKNIMLIGSTGN